MVERGIEKSLKYLRTNKGGEYISKEFENYYSLHESRYERQFLIP